MSIFSLSALLIRDKQRKPTSVARCLRVVKKVTRAALVGSRQARCSAYRDDKISHLTTVIMPSTTATKPRRAKRNNLTKLLAQVLAPAGEAITVADSEGYIIEANDAVEKVYRWPREAILGQHALKFCPKTDYWPKLSQEIWRSISEEGAWDGVVINHDANGRRFAILLRARKVVHAGVPYVISFARPFPSIAPFGLSPQEARCFTLLGQGYAVKEIAADLGAARATIVEYLTRVWGKAGQQKRPFSLSVMKRLAVQCAEGGWDAQMKISGQFH